MGLPQLAIDALKRGRPAAWPQPDEHVRVGVPAWGPSVAPVPATCSA